MKNRIIIAPYNQFELLRTLAKWGVNAFNLRVFNTQSLCEYVNNSNGYYSNKVSLSIYERRIAFYNIFTKYDYFNNGTYSDACKLENTLNSLRELIVKDEEKEIEDKLLNTKDNNERIKHEAILNSYKDYIKYLYDNNKTDPINIQREIINNKYKIDSEIILLKELDYTPLEIELYNSISDNVIEKSIVEIFNKEVKPTCLNYLYKANGYLHEVTNIFSIIKKNNLSLDECTIVYTDGLKYRNAIKECSNRLNLDVSFIEGHDAIEYNSYKVFNLLIRLHDGLFGYDVLSNLIEDRSFNLNKLLDDISFDKNVDHYIKEYKEFISLLGDLKFTFDSNINDRIFNNYNKYNSDYKHIESVKLFKEIFDKGFKYILENYTVIDDQAVLDSLISNISVFNDLDDSVRYDCYKSISNSLVYKKLSKEGQICACPFDLALSCVRKNMFFVGNDDDSTKVSLAENCLIFDDKYLEFSKDAPTSLNKIVKAYKNYKDIIKAISNIGATLYISYSGSDEVELKSHNFISCLYDLYTENNEVSFEDFEKEFMDVNGYYDNDLFEEEDYIKEYVEKNKIIEKQKQVAEEKEMIDDLFKREYSPTALEKALYCKRNFLYTKILNLEDMNEYDVFDKFKNTDLGLMFHNVMECGIKNKDKDRDDVLKYADEEFNKILSIRNPILTNELDEYKEFFMNLCSNGFDYIKDIKGETEKVLDGSFNELKFNGRTDLLTDDSVIDYKTKGKIEHKEGDIYSCFQALLYAYISDRDIDHIEYYYPLFNKKVITTYDKGKVEGILKYIENVIDTQDFETYDVILSKIADKEKLAVFKEKFGKLDDVCKYCQYNDICGVKNETD